MKYLKIPISSKKERKPGTIFKNVTGSLYYQPLDAEADSELLLNVESLVAEVEELYTVVSDEDIFTTPAASIPGGISTKDLLEVLEAIGGMSRGIRS